MNHNYVGQYNLDMKSSYFPMPIAQSISSVLGMFLGSRLGSAAHLSASRFTGSTFLAQCGC